MSGYRPLASAPYDNYGQARQQRSADPARAPAPAAASFEVVFAQDRSGLASPGAPNLLGRIEIARDVSEEALLALLVPSGG